MRSVGQQTSSSSETTNNSGVSRRDFLRFGSVGLLSIPKGTQAASLDVEKTGPQHAQHVIFLCLNGGPSQFETFDPKPEATQGVRGPYKAISTNVSGISLSETLPRLAQRADKFSLIRSLWHDAAPIHETGMQMLLTGRLARRGVSSPSLASIVARHLASGDNLPPQFVLPHPSTENSAPLEIALGSDATPYGDTRFAQDCYRAARLVERGSRFVTVNMFEKLNGQLTWDCHANKSTAPARITDYGSTICPEFDKACSALLDDLAQRGLLESTLVIAAGEFGRTPRINDLGGRDHWPGVWSALIAGGGITGGTIVGSSDARGAVPTDHPVSLADLASTILAATGIDPTTTYEADSPLAGLPLADGKPLASLISMPSVIAPTAIV
ncbi:MAG: DUF1501 domain-containing protein [Planctomycetaceae bacterium]|nr:DUF1501 domain-containing protein [Planctomycetaceae bacterium]